MEHNAKWINETFGTCFREDFPLSVVPKTGLLIEDMANHRDDLKKAGFTHPLVLMQLSDIFASTFEPE